MEVAENGEDEVVRLLHLWGLSDLKAKFKANYIVPQALEFLTEEDIVDLIPKIGQRAIFRGRLLQWRQQNALPPPKSLTSYKIEKVPKPDTDAEVIEKVKEPSPPPPIKVQPKVQANLTKPSQKAKPHDEVVPKPSIQSKVQKFYISPVALKPDSPIRLLSPSPPLLPSHIAAPDLTPFVTSIIRVETNCDKKPSTQATETNPPSKVKRTRILQKIKINERPPTPASESSPRSVTKVAEPKPNSEGNNADQFEEEQPDARHLYPIIKLETESADASWNEYNNEPEMTVEPESQPQVITKREPEEAVADSTDVQPEAMDALESEFYNENDNPLLKLEQMSPKNIRPRRRRARPPRKFDIRNILMNTPMGRHVLQFYEKNERLDSERRRMLIDAIIQDCWTSNRHISPNNCIAIAMEIVRVLPNENMSDYFQAQAGKNPRSPLYNKYRNMRRRFFIGKKGLPPPICANTRTPKSLTQPTADAEVDDVYIIS